MDEQERVTDSPTYNAATPPLENAQKPQETKHKLNWKGFLLALVIVGLLDWGALTILHSENNQKLVPPTTPTKTPNPTANWKTYTSKDKSFSFQYPDSWKEARKESGMEIILTAPLSPECSPPHACGGGLNGVSVSVLANPTALSLQNFIAEDKQNRFSLSHFTKNSSTLGLSNDWVIDRNPPGGAGPGQEALLAYGNNVIEFYCGSCSNETFDQILSTVKFTNAHTTTTQPNVNANQELQTVVQTFYDDYRNNQCPQQLTNQHCTFRDYEIISSELLTKLETESAKGYDPVLCAQNIPNKVQVQKPEISNTNATVVVDTFYEVENVPIKVLLKRSADSWLLTDIICPQHPTVSLKK
jgi:hypothetical protein